MARIVELHPGADQIVRVVSVRLSNGHIFVRYQLIPNKEFVFLQVRKKKQFKLYFEKWIFQRGRHVCNCEQA